MKKDDIRRMMSFGNGGSYAPEHMARELENSGMLCMSMKEGKSERAGRSYLYPGMNHEPLKLGL